MASAGIDMVTGAVLTNLAHVRQSFKVIFSTRIASRILARTFGSRVPGLLGRNMAPPTLALFFQAIIVGVELWEPRLRIVQIVYPAPPNTPVAMRLGKIAFAILASYRPNALDGDTTTDVQQIWL